MKICKGTNRVVFVFESMGFVVKVPIIHFVRLFRGMMMKHELGFGFWLSASPKCCEGAKWCVNGLVENWSEWRFSKTMGEQAFILPTYISLFGLLNICPYSDDFPADKFKGLEKKMGDMSNGSIAWDSHHFTNSKNFCVHQGCIKMRDYGGASTQKVIRWNVKAFNTLRPS